MLNEWMLNKLDGAVAVETDQLPTSPAEMHNQRGLDPKTN